MLLFGGQSVINTISLHSFFGVFHFIFQCVRSFSGFGYSTQQSFIIIWGRFIQRSSLGALSFVFSYT
jgi:hypothetical protein